MEKPASLMSGMDWPAFLYGLSVALVASLLSVIRARNIQRLMGKPLSPWHVVITDTLLGGLVGGVLGLAGPMAFKVFQSPAGVLLCAGIGGILGPALTDLVRDTGPDVLLKKLGLERVKKDGDSADVEKK